MLSTYIGRRGVRSTSGSSQAGRFLDPSGIRSPQVTPRER